MRIGLPDCTHPWVEYGKWKWPTSKVWNLRCLQCNQEEDIYHSMR